MPQKRGNVWLAAAGIIYHNKRFLVVKKIYGGLKGKWSFPAGFVDEGETIDQAVLREIKEETGLDCTVRGIAGIRTGVIDNLVSDNLIVFYLDYISGKLQLQATEIELAAWLTKEELQTDKDTSNFVRYFLEEETALQKLTPIEKTPHKTFNYTQYKVFI
jgi:ADP-ribose pyrophosphatase YjhB (NUDIX family)